MKRLAILFHCLYLTACAPQGEGDGSVFTAYQEGYAWAQSYAHAHSQCVPSRDATIPQKLTARGCHAYLDDHPEAMHRDNVLDDPNMVRTSPLDDPVIRPAPSADDFEWGYAWAEREGLQSFEECQTAERSDTYVAGCEQYIQDLMDAQHEG